MQYPNAFASNISRCDGNIYEIQDHQIISTGII